MRRTRFSSTPLLPENTVAGAAMAVMAAVMCYLASLALGAALLVVAATQTWIRQSEARLTIQIVETESASARDQLPSVLAELERWDEIAQARVLSEEALQSLLEPWLGEGNVSSELPIPILIDVLPVAAGALDSDKLAARLADLAPGAQLDRHQHWRDQLARASNQLTGMTALVLLLIGAACAIVILFATRASLSANRDVLQILHLIGAQDSFIARRFGWRFLRLSSLASLSGWALACLSLELLAAAHASIPTLSRVLYAQLASVPLAVVVFGWVMTRRYVMGALQRMG